MVTQERLSKLRSELPKGYVAKLHLITGKSYALISRVLNGHIDNIDVLEAALKLRDDYQQRKTNLINSI